MSQGLTGFCESASTNMCICEILGGAERAIDAGLVHHQQAGSMEDVCVVVLVFYTAMPIIRFVIRGLIW